MMPEMKGLACQQIAEQLTASEKLTLHSDGTSKFGQRYGDYSLGLSETLTGSAKVALSTLKVILSDIDLIVGEGTGNKILTCIKNTMSDRHIVERKFTCNYLLEDYRAQIYFAYGCSRWDMLSIDEQSNLSSLNNFFVECMSLLAW